MHDLPLIFWTSTSHPCIVRGLLCTLNSSMTLYMYCCNSIYDLTSNGHMLPDLTVQKYNNKL